MSTEKIGTHRKFGRIELLASADGSPTLHLPDVDETYHSRYGALNESAHVFINAGLAEKAKKKTEISILEVGLGTGLNAALAAHYAKENNLQLTYYGLEPYPIGSQAEVIVQGQISDEYLKSTLVQIHRCEWDMPTTLNSNCLFIKLPLELEEYTTPKVDLIFHDAFAPRVQPELWTKAIFDFQFTLLEDNGIWVSYCAKGQVKRDLAAAGFVVETLPGPPRKHEMVRSRKA